MTKKLLAVFGATGQQGGSVIANVLQDAELVAEYDIRAITRDMQSEKALRLQNYAQVVAADMSDETSVKAALTGVHTVYIMSTPDFGETPVETEFNTIKAVANVAVERGVQYIIFSTLPAVEKLSDGKYTAVTAFDAKAKAEEYIRTLPLKSAFVSLGSYMENFESQTFIAPQANGKGQWVLRRPQAARSKMPLLCCGADTGKFVGAVLADPDKFEGKRLCAATALYSMEEIVATLSKALGQDIIYEQISADQFRKGLPFANDLFTDAFLFYDEYAYFGKDAEKSIAWAVANARGKPSTFEEYLQAHPFKFI